MKKTLTIELRPDGTVSHDFGGAFDGACCGPDERRIIAKLKARGIVLGEPTVSCRLPATERLASIRKGDCVKGDVR